MKKIEYDSPKDFNYSYDGRNLVIQGVKNTSAIEINIPPLIDGIPVSAIGNSAFTFCHNLKRITVPDSVTIVENSAFKGCEALVEVVLSSELVSLGNTAFAGCENLKRITISNHTDRFEINTFKGCTSLEKVYVKLKETYHLREDGTPNPAKNPTIREFAVGSSAAETVWACLKAIISATDPRSNYMGKYDSVFLEIYDEDDLFRIASFRLSDPYDMTPQTEYVYRSTLTGMIMSVIRNDKVDRLTKIGALGCIDNEELDSYIDLASRIGGGCIAYLLEHKNRTTGIKVSDFSL
ncbi:MAG: leucine-rich repeat domain-containing protein [Firmicutes bacterium]|nr:leucine-rich repeat domain-containing protein [Bacillota bacterium]